MAVQTTIASLSQTASSNGPDGATDAPSTLDDALRYHGAFIAQLRDAAHVYAGSIAGTNTVTGSISSNPTAYTTGQVYGWIVASANTGAVTVNFNSIGAKSLTKKGTSPLVGGELLAGDCVTAMYDGTQFQLLGVSQVTSGTAVTLSGASVDFTGIPSWVKKINIPIAGLSTNGTSIPMIQIGDSGGIETINYVGTTAQVANTPSASVSAYSTGFLLNGAHNATAVYHGLAVLTLLDSATNLWSFAVTLGRGDSSTTCGWGGGSKALSATLDRIRITTVGGTDTFDVGMANIIYE